jgi:hypothetical protein
VESVPQDMPRERGKCAGCAIAARRTPQGSAQGAADVLHGVRDAVALRVSLHDASEGGIGVQEPAGCVAQLQTVLNCVERVVQCPAQPAEASASSRSEHASRMPTRCSNAALSGVGRFGGADPDRHVTGTFARNHALAHLSLADFARTD